MSYAAYSIMKRAWIMPRDEQPQGGRQTFFRRERSEWRCFFPKAHGQDRIPSDNIVVP